VVLIFNPASRGGRSGRGAVVTRVAQALAGLGHSVEVIATEAAGSAGAQARAAAEAGAAVVFACGGDGTVHEAMQGLVGAPNTALGIVPMGTANALARHLGLSLDPVEAALQQIGGLAGLLPVGTIEFAERRRYFAVMAGAGPDGTLVYELAEAQKSGWGRLAYYFHALRLYATRRFQPFELEYVEAKSGRTVSERAICAMAVRVSSLGGIFARVAGRWTSPEETRLVLVRPPALISLPLWIVLGWLGLETVNPLAQILPIREFSCLPLGGSTAQLEADGEWLGRLPMRVSAAPGALRILRPQRKSVSR